MDYVTVQIETKEPYAVFIGSDLLNKCGKIIAEEIKPCSAAIISDDSIIQLYGQCVKASMENAGFRVCTFSFPADEKSKSPETLISILDFLAENGFDRNDAVIALGGGVAGDVAGLAAAIYMRGMKLVQIPTSLLAMVDSSVGGKTAVNLTQGKNLMGAFKQPKLVICDTQVLRSLPKEQFSCGMAEVIKYAIICDEELFDLLYRTDDKSVFNEDSLIKIITCCVEIKGKIVALDEFDIGERQLLNFGHTVGHAIEKCSGYAINHGQAVGIGMTIITDVSEKLGICQPGTKELLVKVLDAFDIQSETVIPAKILFEAILTDKKRNGDEITLVLPKKTGECICRSFPISEVEDLIHKSLEGRQ